MPFSSKYYFLPLLAVALKLASAQSGLILALNPSYQEQSSWCWAASDQMVLKYWGQNRNQCDFANNAASHGRCSIPGSCCPANAACNLRCSPQIQDFTSWPIHVSQTLGPDQAKNEIIAGRPFILQWNWDTGGSHIMVGKGYVTANPTLWIYMNDPIRGEVAYPYSQFVTHTGNVWSNIHP